MLGYSRRHTAAILGVTAFFCLAALPNVLPASTLERLPAWAQRTVPLGIDLTGGEHVVLAVDLEDAKRRQASLVREEVREMLRWQRIGYAGLVARGDSVELRVREQSDVPRVLARLSESQRLPPDTSRLRGHANVFPDPAGRPILTAVRNAPHPPPTFNATSEGVVILLKLNQAAMDDRILRLRQGSMGQIKWRLEALGVPIRIQAVGSDRIALDLPQFDLSRLLVH